jgi:hypothetical protein
MATPEVKGQEPSKEDSRCERVRQIIAQELQICRMAGMRITDCDAHDTHSVINRRLREAQLLDGDQTFHEVYPGLLEEVMSPPNSKPQAEVTRLRANHATTTPPPKHSPSE